MKVSLRATYGIIAAVDLALHHAEHPVCAKSIAKRQAIPARFLEQVLHAMKKAGVVTSQRGAQGGYVLSRKPWELSVADILDALEGPLLTTNGAGVVTGIQAGGPARTFVGSCETSGIECVIRSHRRGVGQAPARSRRATYIDVSHLKFRMRRQHITSEPTRSL